MMLFQQKRRNMSESVVNKQFQTPEQTVRQLSGLMCPSPSQGALLFQRLYILLIRMQSVRVFESHFQLFPILSQHACSSDAAQRPGVYGSNLHRLVNILVFQTRKLLPFLLESMSKSYAVTCKCQCVQLVNLPQGFNFDAFML